MANHKLFFITGVSSGFGHAFAAEALRDGHRVVGTVRNANDASEFTALDPEGRARAEMLDVTDDAAVFAAVERTEQTVGPIDVLIANAGYGHEGTIEESTMADLRRQFAINVFGAVATIKAVLPFMRERRSGHVIAMSSIWGLRTAPLMGYYIGSKYALEGIVETLAEEVEHLGVRVTAVEPGPFRTDWAGRSMVRVPSELPDYRQLAPLRKARLASKGHQPGDPVRAARALLHLIDMERPPRHLLLGSDALRLVTESRAGVDAELHAFEALSRSTDFPVGARDVGSSSQQTVRVRRR
jgi:NAD(P)-dependent dehydrogenase (short-subunit alcohol dehydrogenase family)